MSIPGSTNPLLLAQSAADSGYKIEKSLRFNKDDSVKLSRTFTAAGDQTKFTLSFWFKNCDAGATNYKYLFCLDNGGNSQLSLRSGHLKTTFYDDVTGSDWAVILSTASTHLFRDPSAWYHIVISIDTAAGTTNADRQKIWVNGEQLDLTFTTYWGGLMTGDVKGWNTAAEHFIGMRGTSGGGNWLAAEYYFIDGQALTASDFGEFNSTTGVWDPKEYTGTYGTNGFYLKFNNTSDLGEDSSGNGNDWTATNFSTTAGADNDSLTDTPTNYGDDSGLGGEVRGNYCTMNPLDSGTLLNPSVAPISNGNLEVGGSGSTSYYAFIVNGTQAMSSGKYYWEVLFEGTTASYRNWIGINSGPTDGDTAGVENFGEAWPEAYTYHSGVGNKINYGQHGGNPVVQAYGNSYGFGDLISVAFDADTGTIWFAKNGVWQNSATTSEIEAGTTTNAAWTGLSGAFRPVVAWYFPDHKYTLNFGARQFSFAAPSGFKCLCTQNLTDPTIEDPSKHFDVATATGNNILSAANALTDGADFVWIKDRDTSSTNHILFNRINNPDMDGDTHMRSNEPDDEDDCQSYSAPAGNSVAWVWNAGTANFFNDASATGIGTIDSTYRANPSAGFSCVSYTGSGTSGDTVAHGLNDKPQLILTKNRDNNDYWAVYHTSLTSGYALQLDDETDEFAGSQIYTSTAPTSTVFTVGSNDAVNAASEKYISYCWSEVESYSKFGSYKGNGDADADGAFIYTGFRPAYVLVKTSTAAVKWSIFDNKREGYNDSNSRLYASNDGAEATSGTIDLLSNGFKCVRDTTLTNDSSETYIYAAFAEHPFKYARAR